MAKKIPLRQCVGCGEMKGKKEMMRVLRTEENEICLVKILFAIWFGQL